MWPPAARAARGDRNWLIAVVFVGRARAAAAGLAPVTDDLAGGRVPVADPAAQRLELHHAIADLDHAPVDAPAALIDLDQIIGVDVGELHRDRSRSGQRRIALGGSSNDTVGAATSSRARVGTPSATWAVGDTSGCQLHS